MNIDLKRRADIRMAQHLAQAFNVYSSLHTAGGIRMPQYMKISVRDARCFQQGSVLILHRPWLHRHIFSGQEIVFSVWMGLDDFFQKGGHVPRQGDGTPSTIAFGRQHHQASAFPAADTLHRFADMEHPISQVNIFIL